MMAENLRQRLQITPDRLEALNDVLLNPDMRIVNEFLDVVAKYGADAMKFTLNSSPTTTTYTHPQLTILYIFYIGLSQLTANPIHERVCFPAPSFLYPRIKML